ncbi:MAG: ribonuclease III [Firmicutes bacterium]|nr:ribonuclease III [Bacillota bacterium]
MDNSIEEVEAILGYVFKDKNILVTGLTHSSYANDYLGSSTKGNERLEFLGDAILDMVISADLYDRFPEKQEGFLSKLRAEIVCTEALAEVAEHFKLNEYMLMGKGEEAKGGRYRHSITSDLVEALIAAVYMDGGFENAQRIVHRLMDNTVEKGCRNMLPSDSKTKLQERCQKNGGEAPVYRIIKEEGPDHDKTFTAGVFIGGEQIAEGVGKTKKEAESAAAADALLKIEK